MKPPMPRWPASSMPLFRCGNSAFPASGIWTAPSPRSPARRGGPVILVEPSDNIGGGAPGDGTAILRAFLRHGVTGCAVAIADRSASRASPTPSPAKRADRHRRQRQHARRRTGDREATFVSRSDGRFTLEDRNSHLAASQGVTFEMGPCAVVRVGDGSRFC